MRTALLFVAALLQGAAAINVCVVLDPGFDMLSHDTTDTASVTSDSSLTGFNADVRRHVFEDRLGWEYSVRVLSSWSEVIVRVRTGECDVGWAPFYVSGNRERCSVNSDTCLSLEGGVNYSADISAYRCCVDFSVNYYPWRVSIMAESSGRKNFFEALIDSMASSFVINFICFAFLFMVVGGHLIWIAERSGNEGFPASYLDGIDDAIWWAVVTATTVGYGDKVPTSPPGRILAMIFMTIGIALFSVLSGHISASFIESRASLNAVVSLADLEGKRVCACARAHFRPSRLAKRAPIPRRVLRVPRIAMRTVPRAAPAPRASCSACVCVCVRACARARVQTRSCWTT